MKNKEKKVLNSSKTSAECGRLEVSSLVVSSLSMIAAIIAVLLTWNSRHGRFFGGCELKPQSTPAIDSLKGYMQRGLDRARERDYSKAVEEFQRLIKEDSHYLGAHQDLGVVQMEQGNVQDAIRSFHQEATVIDCLKSVPYEQLHNFDYFLKKDESADNKNAAVKERLDKAEDTVNYNLACALAKEGETQNALDELKKASANQSIGRSRVKADPDLESIRKTPGYMATLELFPK